MQEQISKAISAKCKGLIRQEEKRRYITGRYREKFGLRTGLTPGVTPFAAPEIWSLSSHFNPYYCLKSADFLGRVLWQKIQSGDYDPSPAAQIDIPKPTGGVRTIMAFSIPDAAISNVFYRKLRDKNSALFSPFSYAYFQDRGLFDAVIQLKSYLDGQQCYVVEMDFSKFFDRIEHRYIDHLIEREGFNISSAERTVVDALLKHRIAPRNSYQSADPIRRTVGVPQGSSISLFLANLAGHELDRKLEQRNGRFVRFADDVVVVTNTYTDALNAVRVFEDHCGFSGLQINHEKSDGISLIKPQSETWDRSFSIDTDDGGKINVKDEFDFLGHKFSRSGTKLSSRSISRTKMRIAKIVYLNLLYPLTKGAFNPARISGSGYDWDLLNCINEIRRFIYGGITEDAIRRYVEGGTRIKQLRGFIGFCPLIDSVEQFADLDGWMLDILRRGLNERYRRIRDLGHPVPLGKTPSKSALLDGSWFQNSSYPTLEPGLPSFALAWRASRKRFKLQGLRAFNNPSYYSSVADGFSGGY